jgi:hypothetical protein
MIISDRNIERLGVEILGLALEPENKFTKFLNSEARFVLAGENEFPVSQQIDIFDYFS